MFTMLVLGIVGIVLLAMLVGGIVAEYKNQRRENQRRMVSENRGVYVKTQNGWMKK